MIQTLLDTKKTNPNVPSTGYMEKQVYVLLKYKESCLNSIGRKDEKGTTPRANQSRMLRE